MSESLWVDFDTWQVNEITAALGSGGSYPDLYVQTVRAVVLESVQDWDNTDYWEFPAVAVMGQNALRESAGHGDGGLSFDIQYPYFWTAIATGKQEDATRDAKILGKRLETLARTMSTTSLPPDSTGELQQGLMIVGSTTLMQYRRHRMEDQIQRNYDNWYVIASLSIGFESNV